MKNEMLAKVAFGLSVLAVVLAAVVSLFAVNLWLAGSQWMLVSILLAVWALFLKK